MRVTEEMLLKMAKLARLRVDDKNKPKLMEEMSEILNWVETLNEVDTEQVEPLIHMSQEINQFRDDEVLHQLSQAQALENAPKTDGTFIIVPKVINSTNE